ncbi:MAG: dihydrofolate reductase family protein [Solirubrobacterales bacterium]|nr:dihydrofolate reductase family protein [Solirubrobacterales bacterium]
MSRVIANAAMSLDGYISGPDESGFDHLFAWYGNGDVTVATAQADRTFHMTPESAAVWRQVTARLGALVVGRRTFDVTDGWAGLHPLGTPVVVLTHRVPEAWVAGHPEAPFTFVTDGIEAAVGAARELAGDADVACTAGVIAQQALDAGLLDEIWVMLVPVVLGGGRPFFETVRSAPVRFEDPIVVPARGVTHLRYRVRARV